MQYKLNSANTFAKAFARMTTTINSIVMAYIFEVIYCSILKYLLAASFKGGGLLGLISTYFDIIKTNSQEILHLHYLI